MSFSYGENLIVNNLNLSIRSGEMVGVVGFSGAGKTTLVDLLTGLLVPDSGKIKVGGKNIFDDVYSYRNNVGYIHQNINIDDATIKENIAYGIPALLIDDDKVERSIHFSQLTSLVESLPNKENEQVGEHGAKLSGGQRQRIGIARALYHDPDILILDEATSSLDNYTESMFMNDVVSLSGEKTLVIIAKNPLKKLPKKKYPICILYLLFDFRYLIARFMSVNPK